MLFRRVPLSACFFGKTVLVLDYNPTDLITKPTKQNSERGKPIDHWLSRVKSPPRIEVLKHCASRVYDVIVEVGERLGRHEQEVV